MEDPIPLNVLLRYMLSPDNDDQAAYPNLYPLAQQRPVIQSKLIIRKLLQIEDAAAVRDSDVPKTDEDEYPRKHPFPILISTSHKLLHFSEPLVMEEDKEDDNNDHGNDEGGGGGGGNDESHHTINNNQSELPHYQRSEPANGTIEMTAIHLGEGTLNSFVHPTSEGDPDDSSMVDVEIGGGDAKHTLGRRDTQLSSERINDDPIDVRDKEGTTVANDGNGAESADGASNDIQLLQAEQEAEHQAATLDNEDYFGISDTRDRGTACDICLLEYQVGDAVAWSPNPDCTHCFHKDCVLDWLVRKPTCPNCRHDYLNGKKDEGV